MPLKGERWASGGVDCMYKVVEHKGSVQGGECENKQDPEESFNACRLKEWKVRNVLCMHLRWPSFDPIAQVVVDNHIRPQLLDCHKFYVNLEYIFDSFTVNKFYKYCWTLIE